MIKIAGVDIESVGTELIGGIVWSVSINMGKKSILEKDCNGLVTLSNQSADILEDDRIEKVIHNAAFDVPYLYHNTYRKNGKSIRVRGYIWDTDITEQVIQGVQFDRKMDDEDPAKIAHGSKLVHTLKRYKLVKAMRKDIVFQFIGRPKGVPFTPAEIHYMEEDTRYLIPLRVMQEAVLKRDEALELGNLEHEFTRMRMIPMKIRGLGFDSDYWIGQVEEDEKELQKLLRKLPKVVANWNSEKQVKAYFQSRGIFIPSYKVLEEVATASGDKVLNDFVATRDLAIRNQKYGMNWINDGYIDPDGRIRAHARQIVNTGRMSMAKPPLHGLPKRSLRRGAIVPAKGHVFVIGDFSGQEIGIMAAMANEKVWIDALLRGDDIHALTASMLYQGEWDAGGVHGCKFPNKCACPVHKALRENAKTINFMLAYGGGPKKFAASTGVSFLQARIIVSRHKRIIPKLTAMLEKNAEYSLNTGEAYSADPYRRRRVLMGEEGWHIENQGKNSPIQMAGANMMKLAAISLPEKYYVPLIVHDEIVVEVPKKEAQTALKSLKQVMEKSADYITGIKGIIKVQPRIAHNFLKE